MWWQLVARVALEARAFLRHLATQTHQFAHELVDLVLLADDDGVQALYGVFCKAGLDFQCSQSIVDV